MINIKNGLCYGNIRIGWCEDRCEDMYVVNMYISTWPEEPKMYNFKILSFKSSLRKMVGNGDHT